MNHTCEKHNWVSASVPCIVCSQEFVKPEGFGSDIAATLTERGARYGKFTGHAKVTQELKRILHQHPKWPALEDDQKESLEMVMHKIGRIVNGDPDYADSWVDIAGYAKLVADRLEGVER